MARTPRSSNTRASTSSRSRKPKTIDLEAVEIKKDDADKSAAEKSSVEAAAAKAADVEKKADTPAEKSGSTEPKKASTQKSKTVPRTAARTRKTTRASSRASTTKTSTSTARTSASKTSSTTSSTAAKTATAEKQAEKKSAQQAKTEPVDAAKPKTAKEPAPAAAPIPKAEKNVKKSESGFGRMAAAGILGGIISLGGAAYLQSSGYLSSAQQERPETPIVDLAPLEQKISTLEERLAQAGNPTVQEVDLGPIETRIINLEGKVAEALELATKFEASNNSSSIDNSLGIETAQQLKEELAGLKTELNQLKSSDDTLSARIDGLPEVKEVKTLSPQEVVDIVSPLIDPLQQAGNKNRQDLAQVRDGLAALNSRIDNEVVARVDEFAQQLEQAATGERLAKSVAINALKSAVENGEPYSAALASVETIAGGSQALENLKKHATSGIPTAKSLLGEFRNLQNNILMAASSSEDSSLTDKMMLSIKSLVTISSDQPLQGDSPEAIISRIEAGLKSGDLIQARSEWDLLPERAKEISLKWADKLLLRSNADLQVQELMKSIEPPKT